MLVHVPVELIGIVEGYSSLCARHIRINFVAPAGTREQTRSSGKPDFHCLASRNRRV
jgi:hypothetical protein